MIARHTHLDRKANSILLACCAFWGLQSILIKVISPEVPALVQASLRTIGATGLLWLWCRQRQVPLFERDGTLPGGLLAGLLFAGEFACLYLGLQYTAASRVTVFAYTAPFWVALLLPRVVPSEKLRGLQWVGLVLAFSGVLLAFSQNLGSEGNSRQLLGDALGLGAGFMWGLTTVSLRASKLKDATAEKTLFYQIAVAAAVSPLVSLALGESWQLQYSATAWSVIAVQTVVGAFASYLAWMWLLRHYPATRMSAFSFLTPLFALIFGVVLLGEPLTLRLVLAMTGVAVGILLVNRRT